MWIRIQVFSWRKIEKIYRTGRYSWRFISIFFWPKNAICLSLLHKGRPRYRRSLHPWKRENPALQNFKFLLRAIFARLDPDPHSQCGSSSNRPKWMLIHTDPDPQHWLFHGGLQDYRTALVGHLRFLFFMFWKCPKGLIHEKNRGCKSLMWSLNCRVSSSRQTHEMPAIFWIRTGLIRIRLFTSFESDPRKIAHVLKCHRGLRYCLQQPFLRSWKLF